jgi:hypothetical protein
MDGLTLCDIWLKIVSRMRQESLDEAGWGAIDLGLCLNQ